MKLECCARAAAVLLPLLLSPAWAAPTAGITLIADTQEHENKGPPDAGLQRSAQRVVRVTLRPAQQTLFAKEVLRDVITRGDDPAPIVHLGDALDLSCRTEWQRFTEVMDSTTRPWVLAPGNHDGFAFGNKLPVGKKFERSLTGMSRPGWNSVCDRGMYWGEPQSFDKNAFIIEYLASVQRRFPAFAAVDLKKPSGWSCPPQATFLRCIAWSIVGAEPWKSHITQIVAVPGAQPPDAPLHLVLLDTSQYAEVPRWAGEEAGVQASQLDAAREMVAAVRSTTQSAFALAGHHHLEQWNPPSRRVLQTFVNDAGVFRFYISAHTHGGHWKPVTVAPNFTMHELNVGSLNDAPVHYRTLQATVADSLLELHSRSVLLAPSADGACTDVALPEKGREDSIEFQAPPSWLEAFLAYGAYWRAKRHELAPEPLIYEDLIARFVPADAPGFKYTWDRTESLATREDVLNEARKLQRLLDDDKSTRRNMRFSIAADQYLNENATDAAALRRHLACLSMAAAVRDAEVDGVDLQPTIKTLQIQDYAIALDGSGGQVTLQR